MLVAWMLTCDAARIYESQRKESDSQRANRKSAGPLKDLQTHLKDLTDSRSETPRDRQVLLRFCRSGERAEDEQTAGGGEDGGSAG